MEALPGQAEAALGGLDILVCNAGVTKDGLAMRMKDEDFDSVIAINLKSTFQLNCAALRPFMKARTGRIINIRLGRGRDGQSGPGQLLRLQSGYDRHEQIAGSGSQLARHYY